MLSEDIDVFRNWTSEMIRASKTVGRGSSWKAKTSEEMAEFRNTMSRVRLSKTEEQINLWDKKAADSLREIWALKTPEQIEIFKKSVKKVWSNRTKEERDAISSKISRTVKSMWDSNLETYGEYRSRRISSSMKTLWKNKSPEEIKTISNKLRDSQLRAWSRLSIEDRSAWVRRAAEGQRRKPSMPEKLIKVYLDSRFPGKWAYNGGGQRGLIIGRKIPDFYYVGDKRVVIEVLGGIGYFHYYEDEKEKINHYSKYGYRCIVIWEWDCYLEDSLNKIFEFEV